MKQILYFLLLNILLIGCQQKRVHFNDLIPEESFPDEAPLWNYDGSHFTGIGFDEFESGQLKSEVGFKDGTEHGMNKTWYSNGQLKFECKYTHGKINGKARLWDENGILLSKAEYREGVLIYEENVSEELEDIYNKGKESLDGLFQEIKRNL